MATGIGICYISHFMATPEMCAYIKNKCRNQYGKNTQNSQSHNMPIKPRFFSCHCFTSDKSPSCFQFEYFYALPKTSEPLKAHSYLSSPCLLWLWQRMSSVEFHLYRSALPFHSVLSSNYKLLLCLK